MMNKMFTLMIQIIHSLKKATDDDNDNDNDIVVFQKATKGRQAGSWRYAVP